MVATAKKNEETQHDGDVAEKAVDADRGLKKVLVQTREQLDKLWSDTFGDLNERLQSTESDIRELVKRVETDGRERLSRILEAVKLDRWAGASAKELLAQPAKLRDELVGQGERLAQGSVSGLGLASEAQLAALEARIAKVAADNAALSARLKKLEGAQKATAKKGTAKKAVSTKKAAAKKKVSKKAPTQKKVSAKNADASKTSTVETTATGKA